jgi:DNA-binding NarL/FixJ family response regulator
MTIRVVLADDHRLVREALRVALERERDIAIVGEATDGTAAIKLVRKVKPDVVVLDVAMPELNGIEAAARIHARHPTVKILALSAHADKRYVLEMLSGGAAGYVTKSAAGRELVQAIRTVAAGGCYLSAELASTVVEGVREARNGTKGPRQLGRREREVLQLVAEGHRSPAIAARLFISVATVEAHRRNIMRKLDLHTVAELTKFAIREGLTSP